MKLTQAFMLATAALIFSPSAFAAKVLQVKGPKVLIDMEGDEFMSGEEFFLINPATSKKSAIIRIRQTKGGKAVAEIVKGKADTDYTLQAKAGSSAPAPAPMSAEVDEESAPRSSKASSKGYQRVPKSSWGITGEYIMITMSTSFTVASSPGQTATADMKGSTFGVGGYYNYMLSNDFSISASADMQQFDAAGSANFAACNNGTTTDCSVKITYLSFYGLGRWYFLKSQINAWVGGGGGFLMAMSKQTNVLKAEQISTNQVFTFSLGAEYQLNKKNYIPFSFDYNMFPSSSTVKANMMVLRFGYGWNF